MKTLDDFFEQFINTKLAEKLGPEYNKFHGSLIEIYKKHDNLVEKVDKIERESYSTRLTNLEKSIGKTTDKQEELIKKVDALEYRSKSYISRTGQAIIDQFNKNIRRQSGY